MKQYCRYCSNCHCGDVVYCDVKQKTMSEEKAKRVNHCRDFDFCELDVFYDGDMDKVYKPREPKQKQCDGQMRLEICL